MIDYKSRKEEVLEEIQKLERILKVTKKEHLRKKIKHEINECKTSLVAIKLAKENLLFVRL